MITLSEFRRAYEREHATTRKVLQAFPVDQISFRPHERSNTALNLGKTFIIEEKMMLLALRNEPVLGSGGFPDAPNEWSEILDVFESQHREILARLDGIGDGDVQAVKFFSGPGQMADFPAVDFLWFMLLDQIHHRGQLSVYLRMAGAKVPSIYGPSADEPWN